MLTFLSLFPCLSILTDSIFFTCLLINFHISYLHVHNYPIPDYQHQNYKSISKSCSKIKNFVKKKLFKAWIALMYQIIGINMNAIVMFSVQNSYLHIRLQHHINDPRITGGKMESLLQSYPTKNNKHSTAKEKVEDFVKHSFFFSNDIHLFLTASINIKCTFVKNEAFCNPFMNDHYKK